MGDVIIDLNDWTRDELIDGIMLFVYNAVKDDTPDDAFSSYKRYLNSRDDEVLRQELNHLFKND